MATLPKQVTKKVFLHVSDYQTNNTELSESDIYLFSYDMSENGYITLLETEVTIDLPDSIDLVTGVVKNLEREKTELWAKIQNIEEKISELTALPAPQETDNSDYKPPF